MYLITFLLSRFELFFGSLADFNLCVTASMRNDLERYGIKAVTMYDKAHESFHKLGSNERSKFYLKLVDVYKINLKYFLNNSFIIYCNLLLIIVFSSLSDSKKKSALLVSSSSWTEDEDFHLLIDAFDSNCIISNHFKPLVIIDFYSNQSLSTKTNRSSRQAT
jgi:hypothetical protein